MRLKEFGARLKMKRICGYGYGLREAAQKIGVSASTLSRAERGWVTSIETFVTLYVWITPSRPAGYYLGLKR